jgi:single-stranded DNA-binding protein
VSITALVAGKLIADPEHRTGQSGKPFVLAKVVAHDGDDDALVSVMAFGDAARQLGAMGKGDAVAINGRAKVTTWTGKDGGARAGLSVTADAVLSAYHVQRRRQAVAELSEGRETNHAGNGTT